MALENPYAHSLDGLNIEDPVKSFFDYCKEREAVRKNRESGVTFPWSDDSLFQKGRFQLFCWLIRFSERSNKDFSLPKGKIQPLCPLYPS